MYKIIVSPRAKTRLRQIRENHQGALKEAIEDLKEDPTSGKSLGEDLTGRFSYKIGVYRIVYKVNSQNKSVLIITAGHRSIAYN